MHGTWSGIDGAGAPVRVRILHVFELRDGLIARENAWFNAADVVRRVEDRSRSGRRGSQRPTEGASLAPWTAQPG